MCLLYALSSKCTLHIKALSALMGSCLPHRWIHLFLTSSFLGNRWKLMFLCFLLLEKHPCIEHVLGIFFKLISRAHLKNRRVLHERWHLTGIVLRAKFWRVMGMGNIDLPSDWAPHAPTGPHCLLPDMWRHFSRMQWPNSVFYRADRPSRTDLIDLDHCPHHHY